MPLDVPLRSRFGARVPATQLLLRSWVGSASTPHPPPSGSPPSDAAMAARCPAFAAAAASPAMCAGGRRLLPHAPPLGPCRSPPHVAGGARRRPALLLRPALAPIPVRAAVPSPTRGSRMAAEGGGGANGGTDGTEDPPGVVTTSSTADAAAPAPAPAPPSPRPAKPTYSQATRLREETEAPFRKARMFVFGASAASAGVGGLVAASRVIAAAVGVRGVQPLDETLPNVRFLGGEGAHIKGHHSRGMRGLAVPVSLCVGLLRIGCLAALLRWHAEGAPVSASHDFNVRTWEAPRPVLSLAVLTPTWCLRSVWGVALAVRVFSIPTTSDFP